MRKYKVIALSVSGSKNRIFRLNDEVTEEHFPDKVAESLRQKGFLKLVGEDDVEPKMVSQEPEVTQSDPEDVTIGEITRKDLMKKLKELEVEFQSNATKAELYDLWLTHKGNG